MKSIYILIVFVLIIYFVFFHDTENFVRDVTTAGGSVDNYFTDLQCVDPTLPIARFRQGNTFEYYSLDGTNPMMMSDFGVPANVKCFKQKSDKGPVTDFNKYVSTDGIRNKSTQSFKLFNDLSNNVYPNYKAINCTPNGLNDPSHVCGKLYNAVINNPTYCPTEIYAHNKDCDNITTNKNTANGVTNQENILSLNQVQGIYSKQKCQSVDCLRKNGAPPSLQSKPPLPVPNASGNCDAVSVFRGVKKTVPGGDIGCVQATATYNAYPALLSTYNTNLANYTNTFNTCLSNCDSTSTNTPNARFCNGSNNVMSYIGNNTTC